MEKIAFITFALRLAIENNATLELPELQGLHEILDEIQLEMQEERLRRFTARN